MNKIQMVCAHCGGTNVKADAFATWNVAAQEWQVSDTMDSGHACEDCDGECRIVERPATPEEIKAGDGLPPYDAATATGMYDRDA